MSTMAVVARTESAPAVVRWAARFAKMRGDSLTVIGCLFGQPITAAAPINPEHPETTEELSPELLARGAPTVIDLAVAFLSGAAAAYALARPSLLGALAGVAIAAALVPPLATVGIAFSEFRWDIVEGAAILFVTNLVAIILGAAFVYRLPGIQGSRLGIRLPLWVRRTVLLLVLLSVALTAPLGYKLADQLIEGQTRPYTLPVSKVIWKAIRDRVHQEHGVTFLSASRFGIEHDIDMVILLTASKPVSAGFISDLKRVATRPRRTI